MHTITTLMRRGVIASIVRIDASLSLISLISSWLPDMVSASPMFRDQHGRVEMGLSVEAGRDVDSL